MTVSASDMKFRRYVEYLSGIIRYINITSFFVFKRLSHLFGWQRVMQSFLYSGNYSFISVGLELHIKTVIRNF